MPSLVFLLDVDNTLLNNDRLKDDLCRRITSAVGAKGNDRFWAIYEEVRKEEEVVDYPATLERFAQASPDLDVDRVRDIVMHVDFADYLYPGAIAALRYLETIGLTIIVSDGDPVYQRLKIERSGLADAVHGRVRLTVHKQAEMSAVFEAFPAEHYALIDDKTTILADMGRLYPDRVTTVLVCQGKYARLRYQPRPEIVVPHIADLVEVPRTEFLQPEANQAQSALPA